MPTISLAGFLPHGACYLWQRELLSLHVISDALIVLAYYSIPVALVYFVRRRKDLEFSWVFLLFAGFILACGTTHLMSVWTVWQPHYWLAGAVKLVTASLSVTTAVVLWLLMPRLLTLPSPAQLRRANADLEQALTDYRRTLGALEESETRFRSAFDYAAVAMSLQTPQRRLLKVNRVLCEMLGYDEEELLDRDSRSYTHPEDLALDETLMGDLLAGQRHQFYREKRYIRKDGRIVWVLLSVALVRGSDQRPDYLLVQAQDISERKQAEQDLTRAKADLEVRVMERTRALAEADRRKDQFMAMLGHELRNFLGPIRNAAAVLDLKSRQLDPTVTWARGIIDRQIRHMVSLVDDMLDVARIAQGKIRLDKAPVEVGTLLNQAAESTAPLMTERSHHLSLDLPEQPLYVDADPLRLVQVIINLLTNAAKYTDNGGQIRLSARRQDDDIIIAVTDNGRGIAPEQLGSIFDAFFQSAEAGQHAQGGLGLGLTLVRRLVELHGGRVEAGSEGLGQGSTFTIRLPAGLDPGQDTLPLPPQVKVDKSRRRILVVDDNQDQARSLAQLLEELGHRTQTVVDGASALETATVWRPDLVFLDLGLPDISGFEVARQLRRRRPQGPVLVAITGYGQDDGPARAREAGFDRYLLKPVMVEALREVLVLD